MNPYKILNLDKNISGKDIIQATGLAMRKKEHLGNEIALAQKLLLDPVSRSCQEFLMFIDLDDVKGNFSKTKPAKLKKVNVDELEYLGTIFR